MEGIAELNQLRQTGLTQIRDHAQQTGRQFAASLLVLVLLQQQIAELLLEPVDLLQRGKPSAGHLKSGQWWSPQNRPMRKHQDKP
jgi:hypothetical protein